MSALTDSLETLLTSVTNLYIGSMPDSPDNCVAIFPTGGFARSMSGTYLEEPTFQIRIRNTSQAAATTLADTIKDLLHGNSTTKILMIQQMGDVQGFGDSVGVGMDPKKRYQCTINFRCYFRR
jgi:hypothetical protein